MSTMKRRTFLKGTIAAGAVLAAASTGLLRPARALAAEWPEAAFESRGIQAAIKGLYGSSDLTSSDAIQIKAPLQAENGAQVPFAVSTSLPDVKNINVLVEANARPLAANMRVERAAGFFSARLKMAKTSDVHVVVNSGGKLYTAKQHIKVTAGGCGG